MKIEMRAPAGMSGMSVDGVQIDVDADGLVSVDLNIATTLESHGFERTGERDITDTRQDFVSQVFMKVREIVENLTDDELRAILALPEDSSTKFWQGCGEAFSKGPAVLIEQSKSVEPPKETKTAEAPKQEEKPVVVPSKDDKPTEAPKK